MQASKHPCHCPSSLRDSENLNPTGSEPLHPSLSAFSEGFRYKFGGRAAADSLRESVFPLRAVRPPSHRKSRGDGDGDPKGDGDGDGHRGVDPNGDRDGNWDRKRTGPGWEPG